MAGDQPPVSLEHRRRRRKRAEIAEQVEVPRAEIPEDDRMSDTMEQVDSGSKEQSDSPATQVNEVSSSNLADNEKSSSSPSVRFIQVLFKCSFFFYRNEHLPLRRILSQSGTAGWKKTKMVTARLLSRRLSSFLLIVNSFLCI